MLKITFLGTGGGRFVVTRQIRATGGFVIDFLKFHMLVDPGPGSLYHYNRLGFDPKKMKALFVSHAHHDHIVDVNLFIELQALLGNKDFVLIADKSSFGEAEGFYYGTKISKQYLGKIKWYKVKENQELKIDDLEFKFTETRHKMDGNVGFVLKYKNTKIGYTSDTHYFEKLREYFKDCDILIANLMRVDDKKYMKHLDIPGLISILKGSEIKKCIITHFGFTVIKRNPKKIAEKIERETGVRVIAADDFKTYWI